VSSPPNPDEILNPDDKGDESLKRFHYQASYAALEAVRLLDEKLNYESVYCEQVEDILVKFKNGKFMGIQVKTKDDGWFTFNDPHIIKSLKRFIEHESKFPDKFVRYVLCTNCGFSRDKTASNLSYCLSLIRKYDGNLELCFDEVNFEKSIEYLSVDTGHDQSLIINTLKKVETVVWYSLKEYERLLSDDITIITNNEYQPIASMTKTAERLTQLTLTAARLPYNSDQPSYYKWLIDPQKAIVESIIENKRITKEKVTNILNECLTQLGILEGISPIEIQNFPTGLNILALKMTKGGIDESDIELVKDYDHSAMRLLLGWSYAHGKKEADVRAEHLRLIVQHECKDAYNRKYDAGKVFGQEMLTLVREHLRQRQSEVTQRYHDCNFEHLEGMAGILTEKCFIWWSEKFKIDEVP
jgi:hypothetical protein